MQESPKITILIAEDDRVHAQLLMQRLKSRGLQTVVAYDAMQAIMVAGRTLPAAILLDVNMPGGTGFEVLKRLQSSIKTGVIPVIAFSASTDPELPGTLAALGAKAFFPKPINFESLYATLCELTHLPTAASSP